MAKRKCKEGHTVEGHKFCPEHGHATEEIKEEEGERKTMAKCLACSTEQPASNKHCGECGESMTIAPTQAELDAAMADTARMAKALTDLPATVTIPAPAPTGIQTADELAIEAERDESGMVLAKALVDRCNALIEADAHQKVAVQALLDELRSSRRDDLGTLAKSQTILLRDNQALHQENAALRADIGAVRGILDDLLGQPMGRRSHLPGSPARPVRVVAKAVTGEQTSTETDDSPRGHQLMAKALTAKKDGKLTSHEIGLLQRYTNRNWSLNQIREHNEELGTRIESAIAA